MGYQQRNRAKTSIVADNVARCFYEIANGNCLGLCCASKSYQYPTSDYHILFHTYLPQQRLCVNVWVMFVLKYNLQRQTRLDMHLNNLHHWSWISQITTAKSIPHIFGLFSKAHNQNKSYGFTGLHKLPLNLSWTLLVNIFLCSSASHSNPCYCFLEA